MFVPSVPDIVTVKEFGVVLLQLKVAIPDPVILLGEMAPHVRPLGTVSERATVPVNPFTAVTVIVDVADWPTFTAAGDVALTVKSTSLNRANVVCVVEPLVPLIVTL